MKTFHAASKQSHVQLVGHRIPWETEVLPLYLLHIDNCNCILHTRVLLILYSFYCFVINVYRPSRFAVLATEFQHQPARDLLAEVIMNNFIQMKS